MKKRTLLTVILSSATLLALYWFSPTWAFEFKPGVQVVRITPSGEGIVELRQIVFEFDKEIAPLGEMKRDANDIPITIVPKVQCEWRWLNTTTLSCNLDEHHALSLATRYQITVNTGSRFKHEFTTLRPAVSNTRLKQWKAPTHPLIRLHTNQPVTAQSLQAVLRFVNATDEKVVANVRVSEPTEFDWQENSEVVGGHKVWDVEPATSLPAGTSVNLTIAAGLSSMLGPEKGTATTSLLHFATFDNFAFLGVECMTLANKTVRFSAKSPQSESEKCSATDGVFLLFNTPITHNEAMSHLQMAPTVEGLNVEEDDSYAVLNALSQNHQKDEVYKIALPRLSPSQRYTLSAPVFQDAFERKLADPFSIAISTDHLRPNYELPYRHAVLELGTPSDILVQLTNLDSWNLRFHGFTATKEITEQTYTQAIAPALDKAVIMPLKIKEHLGNQSGVLYAEFRTVPLSSSPALLFVEVTPYQVHAKLGHFNTLVWVTDLASGKPVAGAKVTLYRDKLTALSASRPSLASGVTNQSGVAMLPGTEVIDPKLSIFEHQWDDGAEQLFIRVDKGDELALLPLLNDYEVSMWRASSGAIWDNLRAKNEHVVTFGATPQGIYRLGDTLQYKIYVRDQNNETLKAPVLKGYALSVLDPTGKVVHERTNITLSQFGAFDGEFTVAKQGSVGWYEFRLSDAQKHTTFPMRVLVSDFTPSPFKVKQELNGELFLAEQSVNVTTHAVLHSGGPYGDAVTRVTGTVSERPFDPQTSLTKDFYFSSSENYERTHEVFQHTAPLSKQGELVSTFVLPSLSIYYGRFSVESAVQDDRGKNIAAHSEALYASVDRFVGLKTKDWMGSANKAMDVSYVVVDAHGKAAVGTPVSITMQYYQSALARIKDVGASYSTHVTSKWVDLASCEGMATAKAESCQFTPSAAGSYRFVARVKDSGGKEQVTSLGFWVSGSEPVIWEENNENVLEIIPDKKSAVVGDKIRFLIKNPYPNATALITIERYGVIDRFVRKLDGNLPVIEIPVKPNYVPGFYLSVIVQSPRVAKPPKPGELDLGKPAFAMGYLKMPVVDRYKEITVKVKAAKEVYRPRDKIKVRLHAQPKIATGKKEPIEIAVAVVDEAVFDLLSGGNQNYDPYNGLYSLDSLDVKNYSLLMRLATRQAFEAKGANPGGDGGVDASGRSLFKYVSYWNPSVLTDSAGNAYVEFEAPDNLTGWRVLAMAVTPSDRAGLGVGQFKVNQPTEIRPAMPNQVVEGDSFGAKFTVMNRTDKTRTIKVDIKAVGAIDDKITPLSFSQILSAAPYERISITMPVQTKALVATKDQTNNVIRFVIKAGDAVDSDALVHTLPIEKNRSLVTAAIYSATTQEHASLDLVFPKDIFTDVGDLRVSLSASILPSIEGAFRYMRDYPYTCFEQRLSKGLMADLYQALKDYTPPTFVWEQSKMLAQQTLDMALNFQAPNGGMCYFKADDEHANPYLSAYAALAFEWLRQSGKAIPGPVENRLHDYLLNYLRHDASPQGYVAGMNASVRATILYALAKQKKTTLTELKRFEPSFASMDLFGQSHFIQAALATEGAEKMASDLMAQIVGRVTQSSGKIWFNDPLSEGYGRILSSTIKSNCAVLDLLVSAAQKNGVASLGDMPTKLARSISQTRGGNDHFENTQENIFCVHALASYSRVYESEIPKMKVKVALDNDVMGTASLTKRAAEPVSFVRSIQKDDPGRAAKVNIERLGDGLLYYTTALSTAPKNAGDLKMNAGFDLQRDYSVMRDKKWVKLAAPIQLKRGDLVRVDLSLSVPQPSNFIVINDPVPGAFEPVNRELATTSELDANTGGNSYDFYYQELLHEVVRFYADFLEKGNYHVSYTAQVVAEGTFTAMSPLAQEMYSPDVMGRDASITLQVAQ